MKQYLEPYFNPLYKSYIGPIPYSQGRTYIFKNMSEETIYISNSKKRLFTLSARQSIQIVRIRRQWVVM